LLRTSDFGLRLSALAAATLLCCSLAAADTNAPVPATNTPAPPPSATKAKPDAPKLVVDDTVNGEVVRVNSKARFVVLSFPVARMPEAGQYLSVWRTNGIVGLVRVSGPQREEITVADLVTGECKAGDEVRERPKEPKPAGK
jgi:hypothetical protein